MRSIRIRCRNTSKYLYNVHYTSIWAHVYVVTSTFTSVNFALLCNPGLATAQCHSALLQALTWLWDDSGQSSFSGQCISMLLVQDLLRLQNQDQGLTRLLTLTRLATPALYSPNKRNLLTSYFKVLWHRARKCCGWDPVAAVIKMLTETEVKGTKYFTVNKANLMCFFGERGILPAMILKYTQNPETNFEKLLTKILEVFQLDEINVHFDQMFCSIFNACFHLKY